jgi:TolA-binding protein
LKKTILTSLFFFITASYSFAQRTIAYTQADKLIYDASQAIEQNRYLDAEGLVMAYLKDSAQIESIHLQQARYYEKLIQFKLKRPNAENQLKEFLQVCTVQQLKQHAYLELAQTKFSAQQYEEAIPYFERIETSNWSIKDQRALQLKLAHCYLVSNETEKAFPILQESQSSQIEKQTKASFQQLCQTYFNGDYLEAKAGLLTYKDVSKYSDLIPYLLTEIDYLTGKKEQALSKSLKQLQNSKKKNIHSEYGQLAGQIYLDKKDYQKATVYFKQYVSVAKAPRKLDFFRLAYAQYQQAQFEEAIASFEKMPKRNDALSQQAYFYLANTYLATRQKEKAYASFLECVKGNFYPELKSHAEFALAKLSYDKGDDIWAQKQLNYIVQTYPNGAYMLEANELLAYLNIKNNRFDDAILAMDKQKTLSPSLRQVYQKANYARGIQMLMSNNTDKAIQYFKASTIYDLDATTTKLNAYWTSETLYRMGKYQEALQTSIIYFSLPKTKLNTQYDRNMHLLRSYLFLHLNQPDELKKEYAFIDKTNKANPLAALGTIKSNFVPEKVPIIDNDPYLITFDAPEIPFDNVYTPLPMDAYYTIGVRDNATVNSSFVKLGVGNFAGFEAEVGLDLTRIAKSPLSVLFRHHKLIGSLSAQDFASTQLGISNTQYIQHHALNVNVLWHKTKHHYYGFDNALYDYPKSSLNQTFQLYELNTQLKPLQANNANISYLPSVALRQYFDNHSAKEQTIIVDIPISKSIGSEASFDLALKANINQLSFMDASNIQIAKQANSFLSIQPSICKQWRAITFKAGLYPTLAQQNHLLPDVSISFPLAILRSRLTLSYLSYLNLNTFQQLTGLNPYLFTNYTVQQSKQTEVNARLTGNISDNCFYNLRVGYGLTSNLPLFLNDTAGDYKQFHLLFDQEVTLFLADFSVDYALNKKIYTGANIQLRPILSLSSNQFAWHYVPAQIDLYGKVQFSRSLSFRTDAFIRYGYAYLAKTTIVNTIYSNTSNMGFDLNLTANLKLGKSWTGYLSVFNIMGSEYQRWTNYANLNTHFRVGLIHTFGNLKN